MEVYCSEAEWPPTDPEADGSLTEPWWVEPGHTHPSHQKSVGGTGRTKAGSASSVGLQLLTEPDASFPLPNWDTATDPCRAEDLPTLPEPHTDQAEEELPGLPLALYPDDIEDPLQTQVCPEVGIGSSPGELDNYLVES